MRYSQLGSVLCLALLIAAMPLTLSKAKDQISSENREKDDSPAKALYEKAALANKTNRVFRFSPKPLFALDIFCPPSGCEASRLKAINDLFQFAKFEVRVFSSQQTFESSDADITLDILTSEKIENAIDEQEFRSSQVKSGRVFFFSEGNSQCRSLTSLTPEQFKVEKAAIWIDEYLPEEQFLSCLAISLARSAGLTINFTYEQSWGSNGAFSKLNAAQRQRVFKSLQQLLAIHFGPFVSPGMNAEQLSNALYMK